MQAPLPYWSNPQQPMQEAIDLSHLRTLAICHYIWGGLTLLCGSMPIIYVIMGIVMLVNPAAFDSGRNTTPPTEAKMVGTILTVMGSVGLLFGWTAGILSILSGRALARQRRWTFSFVVAIINCMAMPIGTVLGVFTLMVLSRATVKALYGQR